MKRRIINIERELCNGCGLCVSACHEGAIGLDSENKAYLIREDYCDGLGDCLPVCPTNAIKFIEKETLAYNEEEVKKNMALKQSASNETKPHFGCPGMAARSFNNSSNSATAQNSQSKPSFSGCPSSAMKSFNKIAPQEANVSSADNFAQAPKSMLNQWPVQIKLVPINAPYFKNSNLLIAADCSAFACGDFHNKFMKNRITLIGCPKLDEGDYSEKLTAILENNEIKSVTVVKMEVPCCTGLQNAAIKALKNCGKMIPWNVVTLSLQGEILE